jgi:hypothetical protein
LAPEARFWRDTVCDDQAVAPLVFVLKHWSSVRQLSSPGSAERSELMLCVATIGINRAWRDSANVRSSPVGSVHRLSRRRGTRRRRKAAQVEQFDIDSALAKAISVLNNAGALWTDASLDDRLRLQEVLFPQGLVCDGAGFQPPVTCLSFYP